MRINFIGKVLCLVSILMVVTGIVVSIKDNATKLDTVQSVDKNLTEVALNDNKVDGIQLRASEDSNLQLDEMNMNVAPGTLIRVVVFDNLTKEELVAKLNRVLGGAMSGKGELVVTESLKRKISPYVAAAIMMHETGNGSSSMCHTCYNFGGQKGSGCGAYQRFASVDDGMTKMIDNLYRNYYAKGLTTIEAIGSRYAESGTWPAMIHSYVNKIRSS